MLQLMFLGLALDILAGFSFASDCKAYQSGILHMPICQESRQTGNDEVLGGNDRSAKYQHIVFIEIVFVALVVDDRHQHLHLDVPSGRPCHS